MMKRDDIKFSHSFEEELLSEALSLARRKAEPFLDVCQSPIEIQFIAAFCTFARFMNVRAVLSKNLEPDKSQIEILPQYQIESYRVDFFIRSAKHSAIVECDGRQFHHVRREQIERDRVRDSRLSELGYKVFRFPGAEIDAEPFWCAAEVLMWVARGEVFDRR